MNLADFFGGKQLYVFGAGYAGRAVAQAIPYAIQAFIDNDSTKWGRKLLGVPIVSPAIVSAMDANGFIIVASIHYEEIKQQLLGEGYAENVHFFDGYQRLNEIKRMFSQAPLQVYDDVIQLTADDYQSALDHVVERVKERYQLSSVYTFGEISQVSISDLDAVLVMNEPKHKLFEIKAFLQAEIRSSEKLSYIYEHPPMLLHEGMAQVVHLFHTVNNINKVWGKDCISAQAQERFFYEKTKIWNYNFYRHFQELMARKKIGSREACMRLKNLAHSIQNNALLAGEPRIDAVDRIIESTRDAALGRRLTPDLLLNAVKEMSKFLQESEPQFLLQDELKLTAIHAFPEPYLELYHDIVAKRNPYIIAIDHALASVGLTYREARQLIGSMSIFDIDEYH